jgi:ABC-type Na+ transport system ATPase subunit NatA/energy-coupling factor transporter ATP-binding protein EcfA2
MPRILKVRLEGFSLYSEKKDVEIAFSKGASCLAGANGIGKSTFLAAVNYGLTGVVPDPGRDFASYGSVDEFYKHSLGFADRFFTGRIDDDDRKRAQVSLDLQMPSGVFGITRGVFEREQLRSFVVESSHAERKGFDGTRLTPTGRHLRFKELIPEEIGLESFEQFVFLQHFVFTFDERRQLLFWNRAVMGQALHLCFGLDPKDAELADTLGYEIKRAGSLWRNAQWQAAELRKRVEQLESVLKQETPSEENLEEIRETHKRLLTERDDAEKALHTAELQRMDADVEFAKLTADTAALSAEYERVFNEYIRGKASPASHPVVKSSLDEQRCALCGSSGTQVVTAINAKLSSGCCPLCDSKVTTRARAPNTLKEIDSRLASTKADLAKAIARRDRVSAELSAAAQIRADSVSAIDKFEAGYGLLLEAENGDGGSAIRRTIAGYREQIDILLEKKQKQYEIRERKRKELSRLRRKLIGQYSDAEERFVPFFKDLAHSFLGIELDIRIEAKAGGVSLTFSMRGTARRESFQLSESQRFFIDIALRMALVKFTSPTDRMACLLIDTPEGALDIAYEKRAGDMFARFVSEGFTLIFTANINNSQLPLTLASDCGRARMRLTRMTSWAPLSDVQVQEEALFNSTYDKISAALAKGPRRIGATE